MSKKKTTRRMCICRECDLFVRALTSDDLYRCRWLDEGFVSEKEYKRLGFKTDLFSLYCPYRSLHNADLNVHRALVICRGCSNHHVHRSDTFIYCACDGESGIRADLIDNYLVPDDCHMWLEQLALKQRNTENS